MNILVAVCRRTRGSKHQFTICKPLILPTRDNFTLRPTYRGSNECISVPRKNIIAPSKTPKPTKESRLNFSSSLFQKATPETHSHMNQIPFHYRIALVNN